MASRAMRARAKRIDQGLKATEWLLWAVVGYVAYHAGSAWWDFFKDYN